MTKILDILDSKNQKFDPGVSGMSSDNAQDGIIEAYSNAITTFVDLTDTPANYVGQSGKYVTVGVDQLVFTDPPAGAGEPNRGENLGGAGAEVYAGMNGFNLTFREFLSQSSILAIAQNANDLSFNIVEANITHQNIGGAGTNTHVQIDAHIAASNIHIPAAGTAGQYIRKQSATDYDVLWEDLKIADDPTPVLGGNLQTDGNIISLQDATSVEQGRIAYEAITNGVYLAKVASAGYDPTDGGVLCVPGKLELHGTAIEIFSLREVGGSSRNLQITADGIVYAAELPATGWEASATSTFDHNFTNGDTVGPWVAVTGLTINPVADVDAGDRIDIFASLYVENVEDKPGTLELGIGINGADPALVGASKKIAPESILYVPVSWVSTNHGGVVTTDTLTIFARRGISTDDAHLYLRGTTEIHNITVSVPSGGDGGGGSPTDLGNIPGPSSVTITSSTGGNTVVAGAVSGTAGMMTGAQVDTLASKIDAGGVTYENLDNNGDVGPGVGQLEPGLDNPGTDGFVLSSTAAGVRSWVAQSGGIPEPIDDSYGYLRRGGVSNEWVRGSQVFEGASDPSAGMAIGDVWIDTTP